MSNKGYTLVELVFVLIVMLIGVPGLVGYGMNIYKLMQCDFEKPYRAEVIRAAGVPFVPMGSICGFLTISDGE